MLESIKANCMPPAFTFYFLECEKSVRVRACVCAHLGTLSPTSFESMSITGVLCRECCKYVGLFTMGALYLFMMILGDK